MKTTQREAVSAVHRNAILDAAGQLFTEQGLDRTTMDEVSRAAGYSKRTVYAYFPSKEELHQHLVLRGMRRLRELLDDIAGRRAPFRESYGEICLALDAFYREEPLYFTGILGVIRLPDAIEPSPEPAAVVVSELFAEGEAVNGIIAGLLERGIAEGALRSDLALLPTVFVLWSSLTGLIQLAHNKASYIEHAMGLRTEEFLRSGFDLLYRTIAAKGE